MKSFLLLSATAALIATAACSQQPGDEDRGDRTQPPRGGAYFELFDTDQNGEISMKEIDQAAAILKKRDSDGNGVLTPDELPRPPRPESRNSGNDRHDGPPPPPPRRGERQRPEVDDEAVQNAPAGTVILHGGYETDPRDHGRPVALIAAALGVKPQVFRDAFSGVTPSRVGAPSAALARANKKALMDALGRHGITNERLDEVSNFYRYNRGAGEVWKRTSATATAVVKNGKITELKLTNPGAGYLTAPAVKIAGHPGVKVKATIAFSTDFRTNGRIESLTVVE